MATTFITSLPEDECVLTSRLDSILARTDKTKVDVSVIRDPDGDIDEFFSTTLFAFDGIVEVSALGKLIEERFRAKGRITDMMSVVIDGISLDFIALYCNHNLNSDFDYKRCFWTTSATSLVHRNSAISLAHHFTGSSTYHVKVVGRGPDGRLAMVERDFTRTAGSWWVSFSVDEIIRFALNQTDYEAGADIAEVAYFTVEYGNLQKIFYVVEDPFFLTFRFRNLFNAPEYLDVVGKVKRKTVVDRDTAICGGRSRQYNQVINRTYEVETGPLTPDQALSLEQLISSYDVMLIASADDYDIIITDHSCEVDNDDASLVTMKFTFRLATDRPALLDSEMDALVPSLSQIFSQEFTAEFA